MSAPQLAVQNWKYEATASDLEGALWYKKVGTNGIRIAALIKSAGA